MRQVYEIDDNGYLVLDLPIDINDEVPKNCVTVSPPHGFCRPKWTGSEWVEGATREYIEELATKPPQPSLEDYVLDLEFRLAMLELGL